MLPHTKASILDHPGTRHGFFSRRGGVSQGIYDSLNCGFGSNDVPADINQNRAAIEETMGVGRGRLMTVYQVHSPNVVVVTDPWVPEQAPKADAMVTNQPDLALGVLTADCAPVLLADPKAGVAGAAHAGWKGAIGGVLEATIAAMLSLGAKKHNLCAAVGPCISQSAYEVGDEFRQKFLENAPQSDVFFVAGTRPNHWQFDLPGYVSNRLSKEGIQVSLEVARCTYENEADFFSFRRTTHRSEPDYGRQVSAIALTADQIEQK